MRNMYVLLLLTASLATVSCKKYPGECSCVTLSEDGTYELRTSSGGIAGETKAYSAGNGNIYSFANRSNYKKYTDGQLSKSGSYKIIWDSSFVLHRPASRIIFDNEESALRTLIQFLNNGMTIQEDVYDGRTYEYEKVK